MNQRRVHRHLLSINDDDTTNSRHIYMEQKEGERGQDAGETERERVCVQEGE